MIDKKIEDRIYEILFNHSALSDGNVGVRVAFEDEWPIDEIKSLLKEYAMEAVEKESELWERAWIMYFFEKGGVTAKEGREIIRKYTEFFRKIRAEQREKVGEI